MHRLGQKRGKDEECSRKTCLKMDTENYAEMVVSELKAAQFSSLETQIKLKENVSLASALTYTRVHKVIS